MVLLLNLENLIKQILNAHYNENNAEYQPDGLYSLEDYVKHFELG